MKHYVQEGLRLKRQNLMESGAVCECCEDFLHASNEEHKALEDDVECQKCGQLCACLCHREEKPTGMQPVEQVETEDEIPAEIIEAIEEQEQEKRAPKPKRQPKTKRQPKRTR